MIMKWIFLITARHFEIKYKVRVSSISDVRFNKLILGLSHEYRKFDLSNKIWSTGKHWAIMKEKFVTRRIKRIKGEELSAQNNCDAGALVLLLAFYHSME